MLDLTPCSKLLSEDKKCNSTSTNLNCIKTIKMESTSGEHVLDVIENEFNELLKYPEIYVEPQPDIADSFKQLSKKTYETAVYNNFKFKGKALSKLLVDGFDEEQIWQQSDLLNKAVLSRISQVVHNINPKNIALIISKFNHVQLPSVIKDNKLSESIEDDKTFSDSDQASNEYSGAEDYIFDDDSDSPTELKNDVNVRKPASSQKKLSYKSEVDDQFFKLSTLEEFLRIEDLKEEKGDASGSENEIDFFQDIPSDEEVDFDEESDNEEEKAKKSSRDLMYEDFFDDPESEVGDESDNDIDEEEALAYENVDDSMEMKNAMEEDYDLEEDTENKSNQKTAFELEQEKIRKKIQECEKSMLEPLPWHLTGEVDASSRPIDSLIHHEADFDSNTNQDLTVDKVLTEKIEEITKMAIRNKAFLDVERKYKSTEEAINYKREVTLDQTKSKKSLAEVYEEDYLKKQSKQDEEDPKHKEIKKLMDSLFPQLHALFSHIPKPAIPEIKVVSNLPAVTVEEVAPTSVSDVTLLAPEEVKNKTGLIKGKTERTDTDRKRERRKKKMHQKLKEKKKNEKLESLKANPTGKISKLEKTETLKKLKQHKNTKIAMVDEGRKIKSSKDFFSRLQDTVDTRKVKTNNSNKRKRIQ